MGTIGQRIIPHAPCGQLTSHEHAVAQRTSSQPLRPAHSTAQRAPGPQSTSIHAASPEHRTSHGTPIPHEMSSHAPEELQPIRQPAAPVGHVTSSHAPSPEHWMSQEYAGGHVTRPHGVAPVHAIAQVRAIGSQPPVHWAGQPGGAPLTTQ
jgi:hypothetical protein